MIRVDLEIGQIANMKTGLRPAIDAAMRDALKDLTVQVHAHIVEQVQSKLHSTRDKYLQHLHFKQVSDDTTLITLDRDAMWIEEGIPPNYNMLDGLLKSKKAKTAADGCVLNPRNKVLTSVGWKRIKDIRAGDMVLTHSGKFREVKELLVRPTPIGTEFVRFSPASADGTGQNGPPSKKNSDLVLPSISLTTDHPVLTPNGWKSAGELKNGDLVATPADLTRKCKQCLAPLPINAPLVQTCLNNKCARKLAYKEKRALAYTEEQRRANGKKGSAGAAAVGVYDRPDWGTRNSKTLKALRDRSVASMRARSSDGRWGPELFFEKELESHGLSLGTDFVREFPIKTDRIVNAGGGRTRHSVLFIDFFFPALKLAIELDGQHWHAQPDQIERDAAKEAACRAAGYRLLRIPSHKIYKRGSRLAKHLRLWLKNHSGELGIAWVKVRRMQRGTVNRPDHIYARKYDICLEAEEHSFCCETVFIHNSRYVVVPFEHKKGPTQQTPAQTSLTDTIKKEFKDRKIPYGKLEVGKDGKPKTGLLHSFDIMHSPVKTGQGPGQGHGPVGAVRQGPTGIPFLQGVRVYQKEFTDKAGKSAVKKSIVTFRIASSKHQGTGRWIHPGLEAKRFLDEAASWAKQLWSEEIAKKIAISVSNRF